MKTYIFKKADFYYDYPISVPVRPPGENGKKEEIKEPSKEEIEQYKKNERSSRRQREIANSLAFLVVGIPIYLYHWRVIQQEIKKTN